MANTKIKDANVELVLADLISSSGVGEYLAVGKTGSSDSIKVQISAIKDFISRNLDRITSGDTELIVIDGATSYLKLTIDSTEVARWYPTALEPHVNNSFSLGTSSKKIKDIHLAGGIELGSDSAGDVYYRDITGKLTRLGIGANGYILTVVGTAIAWQPNAASASQYGKTSLIANVPTTITFPTAFGGLSSNVVVITSCYDASGNPVVVTITSITTSNFVAESAAAGTLHYQASRASF